MKVKVSNNTSGTTEGVGAAILAILGVLVAVAATILVMGFAIWLLVPIATAGAVSLGFAQSVAIGALLALVGSAFKP